MNAKKYVAELYILELPHGIECAPYGVSSHGR